MNKDESFDPRTWSGGGSGQGQPAAAIPDLWQAVGERPASAPAPAPQPARPRAPSAVDRPAMAAALAILVLGAAGAWITRSPVGDHGAEGLMAPDSATEAQLVSRSLTLRSPGDIKAALIASGVAAEEARVAAAAAEQALPRAEEVHVLLSLVPAGTGFTLERIQASYGDGSGAVVGRDAAGQLAARAVAAELTSQIRVLRGEINSESFYTSAVSAGVLDTLIPEFINAFSFDFNLAAEVSPGDTFEVAYEQSVSADGRSVGQPQLMFASLTTPEKSRAIYRFAPPGQEVGWFDGNGGSTVRSLMRTPVDGARISSNFGPRFHPVLRYTRLHGGTDFAAPVGTPIYAAADGEVVSASPSSCAGNMVILRHDNGWETRYFHLSRYADGLSPGGRVTQGSTIGDVGNTGTCTTGPHLHYEVHIDGEKVDPLSIKTEAGRKALEGAALEAFVRQRNRVDVARAQHAF